MRSSSNTTAAASTCRAHLPPAPTILAGTPSSSCRPTLRWTTLVARAGWPSSPCHGALWEPPLQPSTMPPRSWRCAACWACLRQAPLRVSSSSSWSPVQQPPQRRLWLRGRDGRSRRPSALAPCRPPGCTQVPYRLMIHPIRPCRHAVLRVHVLPTRAHAAAHDRHHLRHPHVPVCGRGVGGGVLEDGWPGRAGRLAVAVHHW